MFIPTMASVSNDGNFLLATADTHALLTTNVVTNDVSDKHITQNSYCSDCNAPIAHGNMCFHCVSPELSEFGEYLESIKVGKYSKVHDKWGSIIFLRRSKAGNPLEIFFMHHDSWGQYGKELDDRPQLCAFLDGYTVAPVTRATMDFHLGNNESIRRFC
jgi:hypothetical protein